MGMNDAELKFEDDKLWCIVPLPQYGKDVCRRELVMTKEVFVACYNKWIKGKEDGNNT